MSARGLGVMTWGLGVLLVALVAAIIVFVRSGPAVDEQLTAAQREVAAAARIEALAFLTVDGRLQAAVRRGARAAGQAGEALDADSATVLVAANSDVSNTQTGDEPQTRYFRLCLDLVRG